MYMYMYMYMFIYLCTYIPSDAGACQSFGTCFQAFPRPGPEVSVKLYAAGPPQSTLRPAPRRRPARVRAAAAAGPWRAESFQRS